MTVGEPNTTHYISPYTVYVIDEEIIGDGGGRIGDDVLSFHFGWTRDVSCHAHFICPVLDGNVCGDYGVTIDFGTDGETNVCYPRVSYRGEVTKDDLVTIALWFYEGAKYEAGCYFWCTFDGEIPEAVPEKVLDGDLTEYLVRDQINYICVAMLLFCQICFKVDQTTNLDTISVSSPSDQQSQYISPVNIYQLSVDQGKVDSCLNSSSSCLVSSNLLTWSPKSGDDGKYNFVCVTLEGNSCGDYGLRLKVSDASGESVSLVDNVCHAGVVHRGDLGPGSSLDIGLWYAHRALFRVQCYFWATNNGALPTPSVDSGSAIEIVSVFRVKS